MDELLRDELREMFEPWVEAVSNQHDAAARLLQDHGRAIARLWDDNADLRDELHALSNRIEANTRAS